MEELAKYRENIDEIDKKIRELFLDRMRIVGMIADLKMTNDMTVYDHNRETEVLKKNLDFDDPAEMKQYYQEVLEAILKVSKDYQKALILRSTL
ncbi:MAG: chorismate mutase [Bacilli bacterium]|nr:chorismate mutase [Bacilli bacterium]MBN2696605.1 chorismate mutase [Bacilli bacterium]